MGIDVETCVFAQPEIYISIHAPRMGIDVRCLLTRTGKHYFNPRSPDGERLVDFRTVGLRLEISIHAPPRMGSDTACHAVRLRPGLFQSTLPGWGATRVCEPVEVWLVFQSTLPGWGATFVSTPQYLRLPNFNPRSPDGERLRANIRQALHTQHFNPRSPDGERPSEATAKYTSMYFNPRSPDGERRRYDIRDCRPVIISIHAPRMGSDLSRPAHESQNEQFQSTLPGWGATIRVSPYSSPRLISIHAPRMGSDSNILNIFKIDKKISIHAPRMGSDAQTFR